MRTKFRLAASIVVVMIVLIGCGAAGQKPPRTGDEWAYDGKVHDLDDAPDAAEDRWRKEIAAQRWSDEHEMLDPDKLLTDDPPKAPSSYGKVASSSGTSPADDVATSSVAEGDPEGPKTFWERFEAGANTVGKASFAALTVLVTLGMMVAPYLLL
jgi:hypothetical protein